MKKFRFYLRFDREEKWLEAMAENGWILSKKSLLYTFQKAAPEKRTIKIDYREFQNKRDFADYCSLFEESGWKHLAGTKSSGTQYFLKSGENNDEDIFSDTLSRAGMYKRYAQAWETWFVLFIPYLFARGWDFSELLSPAEWYFTPGLWELSGLSFWKAFLFETPFVIFRGIGGWFPLIGMVLCAVMAIWSDCMYRSEKAKYENG